MKKYNKEVDTTWMGEDEDEDTPYDLPRTNSLSPARQRPLPAVKQGSLSPLRLKSNSRTENKAKPNALLQNTSLEETKETVQPIEDPSPLENPTGSHPNLTTDKTTNNTSNENLMDPSLRAPKSPSKKKRKKPKSICGAPSFLRTSTKALRDFFRDNQRDEDRLNMNNLVKELKMCRRDENSKKGKLIFAYLISVLCVLIIV